MKFIRNLLGKKYSEPSNQRIEPVDQLEKSYRDTIGSLVQEANAIEAAAASAVVQRNVLAEVSKVTPVAPAAPAAPAAVNIWDLEDEGGSTELPAMMSDQPLAPLELTSATASAAAARSPARSRRTKTRLIGFEKSDGAVVDLFNDAPTVAPTKSVRFPVGWIVVAEGPGRGESFSLLTGMSQIGRGDDQAVQLDFGDNSISRSNHAAIVYDPDSKEFLLGHGGKSNIVRLNNKPVISNEVIKTGDVIRIGDTVLRFIALCDKDFNWADSTNQENEDVAIA